MPKIVRQKGLRDPSTTLGMTLGSESPTSLKLRAAIQLKTKLIKPQKIKTAPSYKGHRYPMEIIEEAVWLYFNFALSFREVEMVLMRRGVEVSYETTRQWCLKFGQTYANELRRRCPRPGDKWHLDEVVLKIKVNCVILWRAVGQTGVGFDILVQSRCHTRAATRFFKKFSRG